MSWAVSASSTSLIAIGSTSILSVITVRVMNTIRAISTSVITTSLSLPVLRVTFAVGM